MCFLNRRICFSAYSLASMDIKIARRVPIAKALEFIGKPLPATGLCPFCGKSKVRVIKKANRITCRVCIKKPATSVSLVMKVKGLTAEKAAEFLLKGVADKRFGHDTKPMFDGITDGDIQSFVSALKRNKDGVYGIIEDGRCKGGKYKAKKPVFEAMLIFSFIYGFLESSFDSNEYGLTTPCDVEKNAELMFLSPGALKELLKLLRKNFYTEALVNLGVLSRNQCFFLVGKPFVLPHLVSWKGAVLPFGFTAFNTVSSKIGSLYIIESLVFQQNSKMAQQTPSDSIELIVEHISCNKSFSFKPIKKGVQPYVENR